MAGIICDDNGYDCAECGRTVYALVSVGSYELCWTCTDRYVLELAALSCDAKHRGEEFTKEHAARVAGEGI